ncbi:hypothetical protein BH20VER3_BH20VER3_21090 [soil metagenome]
MVLWQKLATTSWLAKQETRLEIVGGSDLAIISRPGKMRSSVQITCRTCGAAEKLQREFGGTIQALPRNWMRPQKAHAPIRIGRRLQIVSEPVLGSMLVIPAAGAFGTGEHGTTAMSLRLLEEATRSLSPGWRLLDVGTGTGILALAARRFGARETLGLDNDPRATAHARQNARLNRITRARFLTTDIRRWKPTARYEFITANLFSELLLDLLPVFHSALRGEGRLILSGILREQADSLIRALRRGGFQLERQRRRGKWLALLARRLERGMLTPLRV